MRIAIWIGHSYRKKLPRVCEAEPVVLSKEETQRVFERLEAAEGRYGLPARLQYGAGLRLSELVRLRIKDVDLVRGTVTVRGGKGDPASLSYAGASKDRVTVLPLSLREELMQQAERAREVWRGDREAGCAGVWLPGALARKYRRAAESFEWFWLWPARQVSVDPATRGKPGCAGLRRGKPGCAGLRRGKPGYAGLRRGKPGYAGLRRGKPGVRGRPASSFAWQSL